MLPEAAKRGGCCFGEERTGKKTQLRHKGPLLPSLGDRQDVPRCWPHETWLTSERLPDQQTPRHQLPAEDLLGRKTNSWRKTRSYQSHRAPRAGGKVGRVHKTDKRQCWREATPGLQNFSDTQSHPLRGAQRNPEWAHKHMRVSGTSRLPGAPPTARHQLQLDSRQPRFLWNQTLPPSPRLALEKWPHARGK